MSRITRTGIPGPDRGFTLTEVAFAIGIFAISLLGILGMLSQQTSMIHKTQERMYVSAILESRLEEIRDLAFDDVAALPSSATFPLSPAVTLTGREINPDIDSAIFETLLENGTGQITISTVGPNLLEIRLVATWNAGPRGNASTMRLSSYVTRQGLNQQ